MCPMSLLLHLQTLTSAMTLNSLTPVTRSASTLTGHTSVSVDMGMDGGWTGIAAMVSVSRRGGEGRGGEGRGVERKGRRGVGGKEKRISCMSQSVAVHTNNSINAQVYHSGWRKSTLFVGGSLSAMHELNELSIKLHTYRE